MWYLFNESSLYKAKILLLVLSPLGGYRNLINIDRFEIQQDWDYQRNIQNALRIYFLSKKKKKKKKIYYKKKKKKK